MEENNKLINENTNLNKNKTGFKEEKKDSTSGKKVSNKFFFIAFKIFPKFIK